MSANDEVKRESAKRTRRSFLIGGVAAAGGYEFYRWLQTAPGDQLIARPFRRTLDFNEALSRGLFQERGLTPTYPLNQATELRINGNYGLKQKLVMDSYRLQVVGVEHAERFPQYVKDVTAWTYKYDGSTDKPTGPDVKEAPKANAGSAKDMSKGAAEGKDDVQKPAVAKPDGGAQAGPPATKPEEGPGPAMTPAFAAAFAKAKQENSDGRPERGMEEAGESDSTLDPDTPGLLLTMDDVHKLPRQELVTQFKCIEGWSQIVQWGGFRLRDFIAAYPPARDEHGNLPKYVYMETPNGDYYVGYDLEECLHPQTMLVTEMGGKPLADLHGAPLRIHMPIKYGYKQIKCVGLIAYTNDKPDDYWTKLGYDWYAGL